MSEESTEGLERWMKIAIGVYVFLLVGLVGIYIHIATLDIEHSAYITGPETFTMTHRNAVRGFVLDAPTGRMITGAKAKFEVVGEGRETIGEATSERHGYFHAILEPGTVEKGSELAVTIRSDRFDEPYRAGADVEFRKPSHDGELPAFRSRLPEKKRGWREHLETSFRGELQVDAFPPNGELVRGLENRVWLRLTRKSDGAPVRGTITLDEVAGPSAEPLSKEHRTDELGWVDIRFKPIGSHRWTIRARSEFGETVQEGKGEVAFTTVPAQFSMQLREHTVTPGDTVTGMVDTLYRSGGFMVDLYDPHHWIGAEAYGISNNQGGFKITAPPSFEVLEGLYRVQVYESVFQPGNAWDSAYVLETADQETSSCRVALEGLLERMAVWFPETWAAYAKAASLPPTIDRRECNRWAGAILSALPRAFEPPTMIINTQEADREALEAWKDDVQALLLIAVIIALLVGLASILVVIFSSAAEQARQLAIIDAEVVDFDVEFDEAESMAAPQIGRMARLAHVMRIVIIIGTLVLFGVGVVLILSLL